MFLNENTLEEVFSLHLSRWTVFWAMIAFGALLVGLTSMVIVSTPIRSYLPGYMDSDLRREMIDNALRTDSLEQLLQVQEQYLANTLAILKGENVVNEIPPLDTILVPESEAEKSETLSEFVHGYEEEERYNLNFPVSPSALPPNLLFYRPVQGIISSPFSARDKHFGIDIAAAPQSSILATMSGTVVFSGFDANGGYIIQLQHSNGFISVYKHNALLIKKQGDTANAGEAIAIVGNTGMLSTGTHLHFELWHNGQPIDPEEFIVF